MESEGHNPQNGLARRALPTVCVFGTYNVRRHPRVQNISEGLASHGYVVMECNIPWEAPTELRVRATRNPLVLLRIILRLLRAYWQLFHIAGKYRHADIVIVAYLGTFDVHLARLIFRNSMIVLDDLAPIAETIKDRGQSASLVRLGALLDALARRRADLVIVDTLEGVRDPKDIVVAVGAGSTWFAARRVGGHQKQSVHTPSHSARRIIWFGVYTPLHGTSSMARELAKALEDGSVEMLTLVGRGQDRASVETLLSGRRNVQFVDWVHIDMLPELVASHDICLGIFGTSSKALRVVPNKVFQGAASGCAIITGDTPAQRRVLGDAVLYADLPWHDIHGGVEVHECVGDGEEPSRTLSCVLRELMLSNELAKAKSRASHSADRFFRPEQIVLPLIAALRNPNRRR